MRRITWKACATLALCGGLAWPCPARAPERSPREILASIDAIAIAGRPPRESTTPKKLAAWEKRRQQAMGRRAGLILELYHADPDHERLPALMEERWLSLGLGTGTGRKEGKAVTRLVEEIDEVAAGTRNEELKINAAYRKLVLKLNSGAVGPDAALSAIDEFTRLAPKDERGARILLQLADLKNDDPEGRKTVLERIVADYPASDAARTAARELARPEGVSKPFDLDFHDAITGAPVSMRKLRGKVVVVDFWATWCGPCVAEMPKMKQLYAKYRGRGVEFIGVSLDYTEDEGGLEKLREFVQEHEIRWPQYYQGNGFKSDFSQSWDIRAIPAVFVVDQEGKLYSSKARGRLDQILPELLKQGPSTPQSAVR